MHIWVVCKFVETPSRFAVQVEEVNKVALSPWNLGLQAASKPSSHIKGVKPPALKLRSAYFGTADVDLPSDATYIDPVNPLTQVPLAESADNSQMHQSPFQQVYEFLWLYNWFVFSLCFNKPPKQNLAIDDTVVQSWSTMQHSLTCSRTRVCSRDIVENANRQLYMIATTPFAQVHLISGVLWLSRGVKSI